MMGTMDQEGLMFPKPGKSKKKIKHHPKSIMHRKEDRTCYLCMILDDNYRKYDYLEEHHAFFGKSGRRLSEEYGLKVYLCHSHHTTLGGPESVHNNQYSRKIIQDRAQRTFEDIYKYDFKSIFGKNYKEDIFMKTSAEIMLEIRKKCDCVKRTGNCAVFVDERCPNAKIVKGVLCTSRWKCTDCGGVKDGDKA